MAKEKETTEEITEEAPAEETAAPAPVKARKVSVGASVKVVTAAGTKVPAKVTKVAGDGLVDLSFNHNGEDFVITSSPFDSTGVKHDSWH